MKGLFFPPHSFLNNTKLLSIYMLYKTWGTGLLMLIRKIGKNYKIIACQCLLVYSWNVVFSVFWLWVTLCQSVWIWFLTLRVKIPEPDWPGFNYDSTDYQLCNLRMFYIPSLFFIFLSKMGFMMSVFLK